MHKSTILASIVGTAAVVAIALAASLKTGSRYKDVGLTQTQKTQNKEKTND